MKIYVINNEIQTKQVSQLLRLNSECAKLQWSTLIEDIPNNVIKSLEILELFIEERIYEVCNENKLVGSLTEEEEEELLTLIRKKYELKLSLGTGVVISGEEADKVAELLEGEKVSQDLLKAIKSGENVVLF